MPNSQDASISWFKLALNKRGLQARSEDVTAEKIEWVAASIRDVTKDVMGLLGKLEKAHPEFKRRMSETGTQ